MEDDLGPLAFAAAAVAVPAAGWFIIHGIQALRDGHRARALQSADTSQKLAALRYFVERCKPRSLSRQARVIDAATSSLVDPREQVRLEAASYFATLAR